MSKTYLMESIQNNLKESEDKKLDKIDKEFFQKEDKFVKNTFGKDSKEYKDYKKQHEDKYGKDYIKESEVIEDFCTSLISALEDAGFSVNTDYHEENSYLEVTDGESGMGIDLYDRTDVNSPFEGKDTIGIGGDTGHPVTILPLYPDNSWDYEMGTPHNEQPEVGMEAYAIFKEISKTTVDEVVNIVRNSFDAYNKGANESNITEDDTVEEPKEQSLEEKFLDYTINVYDVDAFIKSETENKNEAFDYPGGAAIILGEGGKGCVADYEAIYTPFDSTDKEIKIPANDITEWKDGKRDIYLMPQYLVKTQVEELIEKAPKKEMKASEFFKKHDYNPRCQQNYAGMVKYLSGIGFFNQNESTITESAEDIDAFWSKGIKAGDNVESSGAGTVEIIDLNKGADYILLKRNTGYQPFVAAWAPQLDDEGKLSWGQGHYFTTEEEARKYFDSKVRGE